MGKFTDAFWYYGGVGWPVWVPMYSFIETGTRHTSSVYDLGLALIVLMTGLCLYFRPEEPKRVALFGLLTILGTTVFGLLTGTEGVRALVPMLTK